MKNRTRLYNVILPIWLLWLAPPVWLIILPGNLAVDCLVLFLTLLALKHGQKGAALKELWWKIWLLGFAADAVGVAWMILGLFLGEWSPWFDLHLSRHIHNSFGSPLAFLWTLAGVALAGVCIYFFDKRAMKSCAPLSAREKHIAALVLAIVTAPWLFLFPMY